MAYDIGTARGVIEMEYNGRGVDQAQKDLDNTGTKAGKTQQVMNKTGTVFMAAGAAILGGLALGVNAAANFEQRMSAIGAVSGATGKQMDALSDKALQLGKDTVFSASESAQAIEELIKAGISVEDVLNGAADATVNLAAAGAVDMPTAATLAANAMNQFNLNASDMVSVVDSIAGAANASAIDVNDFGESLKQVGAVANLTGLTFDDTATAIALMGQAGIKGSDAGTSLKTFLSNLQPVTKKQIGLFKELGIVTADGANKFFDAKGNIKSMADVSGVLSDALKGMTNQQKTMALETLFGSDAIRAAAVMADKGTEGFNKMGDAMGKVSAAEVAEKRMDNFKGSLEQMKGSLETVGITLGTVLLPPLKQVVDAVADALNWFLNLDSGMQKFIVIALAVIGAVLLIVGAILKFIVMAAKVRVALLLLRGSMLATWAAALGPIALVIAAIAIIVGIIILLWKKNETFRNIVTGAWNAIKDAVSAVADWFTGTLLPALESVWKAITGGVTAVKDVIVNVWNGIVNFFQTVFAVISAIITTYINIWKTIITTALNIIKGIWTAIWGVFGGIIKAVFGLIVAIIRLALAVMFLIIQVWWNMIKQVTQAVWNAIKFVITSVWNSIKQAVRAGVQAVRAVVTAAWNVIRAVTRAVWNGIMAVIKAVWGKIGGTVTAAANRVKSVITSAWNAVKAVTKAVWTWLVQHVGARVIALVEKIKGIKDKVVNFFKGAGSWLFNAGKQIIQGLLNGIESLIHKVTDKLNWLTDHIPKIKGPPSKDEKLLVDNGELIMRSLITGFENMEPAVFSHLQGMTNSMGPSLAAATPSSVPLPTPTASGAPTALRMVGGELRLDKSGRAFIRGVAAEVVDENDYNTARGARRP